MNAKASATKVCPGCSARYPPDALFCPNDGSPLTANSLGVAEAGPASGGGEGHDSYLGREISGHIEIQNLAGVGAMGRVYRAFQKGIDRDVAVKVLHRELSANQQLVARFHREAKVASRLQHPNVVQVHLAGQLPDGAMYIVMEYLDGLSLQSALAASRGPFSLERALHVTLQICDAAGEAHAQGVVHRDIKPENVMLIRRGDDPDFVKVLDFGIARLNWGEQSMATAAGLIFGTARYISPEGAQGEAVGPEGDVYATATLLYQMLAGRTPFEGEQAVALLVQQIHDTPPPLRSLAAAAGIPQPIEAVIMRNLSKSPADRAPDARTFGRALVEAAKSAGLTAEDLVPRSSLFVPQPRNSDPGPAGGSVHPLRVAPPPVHVPEVDMHATTSASPPSAGISPKTQMWSPPAASAPHGSGQSPPVPALHEVAPPPPSQVPVHASGVDRTLDESSGVHAPPDPSAMRIRTEPALLPPVGLNLTPPPPVVAQAPPPPPQQPIHAAPPVVATPSPPPETALASPHLSSTLDDTRTNRRSTPDMARVPARRLIGVVVTCLLVGMAGASLALYQTGMFGQTVGQSSLDEAVAHADEALKHSRWDTPPGDNVRDITNDGLARWPREARLLDVRGRATGELVKEAVGQQLAGDLPGALHLAHLAKELDPTDTTAQHLVDDYERAARKAALDASPAPTSSSHGAVPVMPQHNGSLHPSPTATNPPKVALEASLPHPRIGQTITFTAKVVGPTGPAKPVEEPRFIITGPSLAADTKLTALAGPGGSYIATFAGSEPGKYDISFDGKVDGSAVHTTRTIAVDGDAPAPSTPPSASAPTLPSTIPSAKWL